MKKIYLLCLLLFFSACGFGANTSSPGDTVKAFLTYVQSGEYTEAQELVAYGSLLALYDIEEEYRGIFNMLSFGDISSVEINGTNSHVRLTVNAFDFASLMEDVMAEAFNWIFMDISAAELTSKIEALLKEKINMDYPPILSKEVTVNLEYLEGRWKIVMDKAFADAVTGGMISFAEYAGQWLS